MFFLVLYSYAQNTVRLHVLIDYDEIIMLSHLIQLTIRIQTTSEGGLTEFAFISNRLNANIQCTLFSSCRQAYIDSYR